MLRSATEDGMPSIMSSGVCAGVYWISTGAFSGMEGEAALSWRFIIMREAIIMIP